MARCRRAGSAAPEITPHDCAIESMRHSVFAADPSGVPSSKYALRYQSPSQASFSIATFRKSTCCRQRVARSPSPRASAMRASSQRLAWRNQAIQTLSPLPR